MRLFLWASLGGTLLNAGLMALVLPPILTPVTEDDAGARLTLACRTLAFAFEQDQGVSLPDGSCACLVEALAEDIPDARFAREAEQARQLFVRVTKSALSTDSEARRDLETEFKAMTRDAAIFDPARHARAARACEAEISEAAEAAPVPAPASSRR